MVRHVKYCLIEPFLFQVPFGEIDSVKNWLQIEGPVKKPPQEIAARPVTGFECSRSEVNQINRLFGGLFSRIDVLFTKFENNAFLNIFFR